tara:strand:- start:323 stop:802 length:480 start_codon:yes stop_codon:yes gene_type:complete
MGYINKSLTDCWGTPKKLKEKYEWDTWFDPCPFPRAEFNGLEIDWLPHENIFVNPPYSDKKSWCKKCFDTLEDARSQNKPLKIDLLIPNTTTETKYFHEYILNVATIEFIKGRIKFVDLTNASKVGKGSPHGSIICRFRNVPETISDSEYETLNILNML